MVAGLLWRYWIGACKSGIRVWEQWVFHWSKSVMGGHENKLQALKGNFYGILTSDRSMPFRVYLPECLCGLYTSQKQLSMAVCGRARWLKRIAFSCIARRPGPALFFTGTFFVSISGLSDNKCRWLTRTYLHIWHGGCWEVFSPGGNLRQSGYCYSRLYLCTVFFR
jgi:hypothetical protein